jgi:putative transposase
MKFSFIHAEKANFPVAALCRLLGVSRQGYYAHVKRPLSARLKRDVALQKRVRQVYEDSRGTYGSPRIHAALLHEGECVGKRRIERAMRCLGLRGRMPRRWRATTRANPAHPVASNVLDRNFGASRPNERWVTDITYIWTQEGWCYLAAILDLFSRSVVGWALDATLSTSLPMEALNRAVRRRRPGAGLVHHSDRGCQYTSAQYRDALAELDITVSMSRKGNCWDNAVAESFFATLKTELIYGRAWQTREELRRAVFEYIEIFYNRQRLHSAVDYRTPAQAESDFALGKAA